MDEPQAEPRSRGRAMRILIVDDSPPFRAAARELLEHRGYVVAGEADCARSALDAVAQLAPDGILLDLCLPDENGAFVARHLRTAHPDIAVLIVSADSDRGNPELARRSGARGFVTKAELARIDLTAYWPGPAAS